MCLPRLVNVARFHFRASQGNGIKSRGHWLSTTRGKVCSLNPPEVDDAGAMVCVNRSQVKGLLEDNIKSLYTQIGSTKTQSSLHKHLRAVCDVGKFIQTSGPIVVTQDAAGVYNDAKGSERRR